jgi:hypothetical protein
MKTYFLTPDGDHWKLAKEHAERAVKTFETKKEGIEFSIDFMKNHGGSLRIRKKDGLFQEERTYPRSADPRKSKG